MSTSRSHDDSVPASREEPGALVELRRLLCAASERTRELNAERSGLEEIRASLKADERSLLQRQSAIEEECGDLEASIDTVTRRIASIEAEIEDLERQKAALVVQDDANQRRLDRLAHEAEELEGELGARRYETAEAQTSFHWVLGSVLQMDHRLRKHADAQGGAIAQREKDGEKP